MTTSHIFQSTLPAWRATVIMNVVLRPAIFQSTPPRMGSDLRLVSQQHCCCAFQSTPPSWGATNPVDIPFDRILISIHAPRMGSDIQSTPLTLNSKTISIHAPRMGSDRAILPDFYQPCISIHAPRMRSDNYINDASHAYLHFNPRSPHEERRLM